MEVGPVVAAVSVAVAGVCIAVSSSSLHIKSSKYNKLTVSQVDFDDMLGDAKYNKGFLDNLRCNQSTFAKVCVQLQRLLHEYNVNQNYKHHSFEKKVAIFLYFLGSIGGYREVSGVFGVSKSWTIDIVGVFSDTLSKSAKTWICLPRTLAGWNIIERGFKARKGIPGVVGAVDGTLLEIQRPADLDGFYNRHGDPSLNVQAIVDDRGTFMSIDTRPGSFSDKKIWKLSSFGNSVRSIIPPGCFIVGDSGYTLLPWLIVPFLQHEEGGRLNTRQRHFNHIHSCTRMVVECAFGRLKERWRLLKGVMAEKSLDKTIKLFMSCVVLHNMFLLFNDPLFAEYDPMRDVNSYTQPYNKSTLTPSESTDVFRTIAQHRRIGLARVLFKRHKMQ